MLASIVFRSIAWELFVQIRALYEAPNITSNSIRCQELFIVISRLYSIKDLKRVKNLVYRGLNKPKKEGPQVSVTALCRDGDGMYVRDTIL
jgi:hypothetical protein